MTPTLQEELSRKSLETIEKIESDLKLGKITNAQYGYAVDVLWSAIAGIADKDFVMMMEIMSNKVSHDDSFNIVGFFHNEAGDVVKVVNPCDGTIRLTLNRYGHDSSEIVYKFTDEPNPYLSAFKKLKAIEGSLERKSFIRL